METLSKGVKAKWFSCLVALAVQMPAASGQAPDPPVEKTLSPEVVLSVFGSHSALNLDKREPVLLHVSIGNPRAVNIESNNTAVSQIKEAYKRDGSLDKMDSAERKEFEESSKPQAVPTIVLGTGSLSVLDSISFSLKNSDSGATQALVVKNLSSSSKLTTILNGKSSVQVDYGIETDRISNLPDGKYEMEVSLDTRGKPGVWQGFAKDALPVVIKDGLGDLATKDDSQQRQYLYGEFYLFTKQFDKVDKYAQRLLAVDPQSISAAELQGDAFLGQGQLDNAETAYTEALNRCTQKFGSQSNFKLPPKKTLEAPEYLYRRLGEVLNLKQAAHK